MDLTMGMADPMKSIVAKGIQTEMGTPYPGSGYVTEKMYMLLQLYLQNKGWNNPMEWLQCFTDLKDPSLVPSASYFQMMASRITLDSQGRLVLRENGKIILPFEHFANAVMLKHMNGPHGMHLGLEATVRSVVESYTIGRENFGMDKEFILEVVNSCPNPACRYYKTQLDIGHSKPTYIPEPPAKYSGRLSSVSPSLSVTPVNKEVDKHSSHSAAAAAAAAAAASLSASLQQVPSALTVTPVNPPPPVPRQREEPPPPPMPQPQRQQVEVSAVRQPVEPPPPPRNTPPVQETKYSELLKNNLESLENLSNSNKDLLALHNGSWMNQEGEPKRNYPPANDVSQEKIVRAFGEIMKNMHRMKTCVRPAMCKPYGKQSESLQKTLMDTIQLVQSLRSFLPPPHIQVSSWKNEDKHRSMPIKLKNIASLEDYIDPGRNKLD